jgi:hypothetical protein
MSIEDIFPTFYLEQRLRTFIGSLPDKGKIQIVTFSLQFRPSMVQNDGTKPVSLTCRKGEIEN